VSVYIILALFVAAASHPLDLRYVGPC
jgi:hypothetical protein